MNLPQATAWAAFHTWKRVLETADRQNVKTNIDNDMGAGRLILTSPNGSRWAITVDDSGTLSTSGPL